MGVERGLAREKRGKRSRRRRKENMGGVDLIISSEFVHEVGTRGS